MYDKSSQWLAPHVNIHKVVKNIPLVCCFVIVLLSVALLRELHRQIYIETSVLDVLPSNVSPLVRALSRYIEASYPCMLTELLRSDFSPQRALFGIGSKSYHLRTSL